jgi:hypothetical protein
MAVGTKYIDVPAIFILDPNDDSPIDIDGLVIYLPEVHFGKWINLPKEVMVAIDFEEGISFHKLPFCLKSLLVVLHDGEDIELPKLFAIAQIDIVGALFIIIFQCFEVVVF